MTELILDQVSVKISLADGNIRWILRDISVTCHSGENIGIIGRNGSGKTTLARLMGSLDHPARGKITLHPKRNRRMLVLQRPEDHFIGETVERQIAAFAPKKLTTVDIQNLLAKVGLPLELEHCSPLRLSGGEQRLTAIACALAANASFIILDEPMAGLDSVNRKLVTQTLAHLGSEQKIGLVIISHHPDDLLGLVERLWVLDKGRLIYDGAFCHVPVETLKQCLAPNDVSLYYALRQIESRGVNLPAEVYDGLDPVEISKLLLRSQES